MFFTLACSFWISDCIASILVSSKLYSEENKMKLFFLFLFLFLFEIKRKVTRSAGLLISASWFSMPALSALNRSNRIWHSSKRCWSSTESPLASLFSSRFKSSSCCQSKASLFSSSIVCICEVSMLLNSPIPSLNRPSISNRRSTELRFWVFSLTPEERRNFLRKWKIQTRNLCATRLLRPIHWRRRRTNRDLLKKKNKMKLFVEIFVFSQTWMIIFNRFADFDFLVIFDDLPFDINCFVVSSENIDEQGRFNEPNEFSSYRNKRRTSFSISSWSWVFCRATFLKRRFRTFFIGGVTKSVRFIAEWEKLDFSSTDVRAAIDIFSLCLCPFSSCRFHRRTNSLRLHSTVSTLLRRRRRSNSNLRVNDRRESLTRRKLFSFESFIIERTTKPVRYQQFCTLSFDQTFCKILWCKVDRKALLWKLYRRISRDHVEFPDLNRWKVFHGSFRHPIRQVLEVDPRIHPLNKFQKKKTFRIHRTLPCFYFIQLGDSRKFSTGWISTNLQLWLTSK